MSDALARQAVPEPVAPAPAPADDPLEALPALGRRARALRRPRQIAFVVANETHTLVRYRTGLVFLDRGRGLRLTCVSGLSAVEPNGAFTLWAQQVARELAPQAAERHLFGPGDVDSKLREAWLEYWPPQVQAFVLPGPGDSVAGLAVYLFDEPWPPGMEPLVDTLHQVYGLALSQPRRARAGLGRLWRVGLGLAAVAAVAAALVLVPVRQFVVAPAEIVSLDTLAVTSPLDGVVAVLEVKPNDPVRRGQVLFRLDDTTLRNRLLAAREALEVARAEYLAGAHRAFVSSERPAEAGVLRGRINERLAEVAYLQDQLALLQIRAPRDGVAVYGQENDWIGKPVSAGQRVMDVADPTRPGVQVWLPVADAIALRPGSPLQVVLHADPLNPRTATLEQASYQATRSPEGVAAYRLRATLPAEAGTRLGLRGTARLDGQEVSLGYFLLRRPFTAVRQWLGI